MNISLPRFPSTRRWFSSALIALTLMAGVIPATAHAQARFGGSHTSFGSSFGRGLGWGLGVGIGRAVVYDSVYRSYPYYSYGPVYTTASAPTFYYVTQPAQPQTVIYTTTAPAPTTPAAAAPAPVPVASTTVKASKIVYDANAKPVGVLLLKSDGSQEFVPLAQ